MTLSLVPKPAAFVLVRVNPVATLASLEDPIAAAAAEKLTSRTYVAYVSKAINAFDWKAPHHTYAIQLVSPTIPAACKVDGISADMYTPVFPAASHPFGREPLRPVQPLPWPCYQPSFMRSVVRVPVRLEDDASAVLLEPADAIRHRRILADEDARRGVSLRSATLPANTTGYVNFSDLDEYIGDFEVDRACEDRYYADAVEASLPSNTCIVVDISYDLSMVNELPDPLEFFEEKRRLKQLEAESKARKAELYEISTPKPGNVDFTQEFPQGDHLVSEDIQPIASPETLWTVWEHRTFPEILSSIRIPAPVIREVATRARRLSVFLAHVKEEGLNLLQDWTRAVRFI
ncbi:hypothetical protein DFH09DRAFT_1148407 [Mycena vulgaris]|nr:hypothetical protein DFH09DRAFT_1148407 [Mycena vulgaris]